MAVPRRAAYADCLRDAVRRGVHRRSRRPSASIQIKERNGFQEGRLGRTQRRLRVRSRRIERVARQCRQGLRRTISPPPLLLAAMCVDSRVNFRPDCASARKTLTRQTLCFWSLPKHHGAGTVHGAWLWTTRWPSDRRRSVLPKTAKHRVHRGARPRFSFGTGRSAHAREAPCNAQAVRQRPVVGPRGAGRMDLQGDSQNVTKFRPRNAMRAFDYCHRNGRTSTLGASVQ